LQQVRVAIQRDHGIERAEEILLHGLGVPIAVHAPHQTGFAGGGESENIMARRRELLGQVAKSRLRSAQWPAVRRVDVVIQTAGVYETNVQFIFNRLCVTTCADTHVHDRR
jgi:hypothetical protein